MLSQGPNGMRPLELLAEIAGTRIGVETSSLYAATRHAEKGVPMLLRLLSEMQAQGLESICHHFHVATSMHAGKKQSQWHESPGDIMAWP